MAPSKCGSGSTPEPGSGLLRRSENSNGQSSGSVPHMQICYVASPIDAVPGERSGPIIGLRNLVRHHLIRAGITVYDPSSAWDIGHSNAEPDGRVWVVNEAALIASDYLVALYPGFAESTGVPMEIESMRRQGKPVAVITNRVWSFALRAPGIKLIDWNDNEPAVKEAVQWLQTFNRWS